MKPGVEISSFGTMPDGRPVQLYTLTNQNGLVAKITSFGTIIQELHVPDRQGRLGDVVLGFDRLEPYLGGHPYFGATVGRVANRIANGRFTLDGKQYTLAVNNGPNHLHGGRIGFDKALWQAQPGEGASVKFFHTSPDGDEGYPGTLKVEITMSLSDANEFSIDYVAHCDQSTIINLTNHSFFNLACSGDVLGHQLMLSAAYYTPKQPSGVPTGEVLPVKGTLLDFTTPQAVGTRFADLGGDPLGYDHNYVINRAGKGLALAGRLYDEGTGRMMEVQTTQPGVQLYTGNYLDGTLTGKGGVVYQRHAGLCLETQHYPDSINHHGFPTIVLRPGQAYHHTTVHKFSTR